MENIEKANAEELLDKIFHYMTELLEVKEFSKTVNILTDLGKTIVNAERASFWFWDKEEKQYWTLAAVGNVKITVPEETGIVGRVIADDKEVLCNNPYEDKDFNGKVDEKTGYVTKSILCVPVENSEGEVIGAFQALNKLDGSGKNAPFDEKDIKRMSLVTAFCEKTLESYLLHNEAMVDKLTGLKNRYAFYEYYNKNVIKVAWQMNTCIVMCDIDHFKTVNDTYGHNIGDFVLKEVADVFKKNVGIDDIVVRWGGEEFIFVLNHKTLEEGIEFAQKMRTIIEKHTFEIADISFNITMSFGVNVVDNLFTIEENVKFADDKLYEAKNAGRNRVV